ncbi:hypothetical protein [Enhygromyxa salina]|nr:hypothetical protein [Enhygromyxa salina]
MSWWNRAENWRMIAVPFALAMGIMLLVVSALNLTWWAAGALAASIAYLSLGVVERCIRHVVGRKPTREPEQPRRNS